MAELMHDLHGQPRKAYERSDQHRLLKPVHVVRDLTIPFPFCTPFFGSVDSSQADEFCHPSWHRSTPRIGSIRANLVKSATGIESATLNESLEGGK